MLKVFYSFFFFNLAEGKTFKNFIKDLLEFPNVFFLSALILIVCTRTSEAAWNNSWCLLLFFAKWEDTGMS